MDVDFDKLVGALQSFLDGAFVPVWGTPAKLVKSTQLISGAWAMVFLDRADVKDALGYHDLTPDHLPLSKIFVETTQKNGEKVSVTASHELVEMLVDPATNLCAVGPRGWIYAYEVADAVEEETFPIGRIPMTDFVYPAFFEPFREPRSAQFDHLKRLSKPFQILKGGYMPVFRNGRWTQVFGSRAKGRRFVGEQKWQRTGRRGRPRIH